MVSDFSFINLGDFLSDKTIILLEFLRQNGASRYEQILDSLNFSDDELAIALNEVKKTSIIELTNDEDGEIIYRCPSITRNFLLNNQRSQLLSKEVKKRIVKDRNISSEITLLNAKRFFGNKNHLFYVPEDCPQAVIKIVNDSNKCLSENDLVISWIQSKKAITAIENIKKLNQKNQYHWYVMLIHARFLEILSDNSENYFKEASKIYPYEDYKVDRALASYYQNSFKFDEANSIYKQLLEKTNSKEVIKGYCLSLIFTNELDNLNKALNYLNNLEPSALHKFTLYSYRLGIVKRMAEHFQDEDNIKHMRNIIEIFKDLKKEDLNTYSIPKSFNTQTYKCFFDLLCNPFTPLL